MPSSWCGPQLLVFSVIIVDIDNFTTLCSVFGSFECFYLQLTLVSIWSLLLFFVNILIQCLVDEKNCSCQMQRNTQWLIANFKKHFWIPAVSKSFWKGAKSAKELWWSTKKFNLCWREICIMLDFLTPYYNKENICYTTFTSLLIQKKEIYLQKAS